MNRPPWGLMPWGWHSINQQNFIIMEQSKEKQIKLLEAFPKGFETAYNYDPSADYNAVIARFNGCIAAGDAAGQDAILRQHGGRIALVAKRAYQNCLKSLGID